MCVDIHVQAGCEENLSSVDQSSPLTIHSPSLTFLLTHLTSSLLTHSFNHNQLTVSIFLLQLGEGLRRRPSSSVTYHQHTRPHHTPIISPDTPPSRRNNPTPCNQVMASNGSALTPGRDTSTPRSGTPRPQSNGLSSERRPTFLGACVSDGDGAPPGLRARTLTQQTPCRLFSPASQRSHELFSSAAMRTYMQSLLQRYIVSWLSKYPLLEQWGITQSAMTVMIVGLAAQVTG